MIYAYYFFRCVLIRVFLLSVDRDLSAGHHGFDQLMSDIMNSQAPTVRLNRELAGLRLDPDTKFAREMTSQV